MDYVNKLFAAKMNEIEEEQAGFRGNEKGCG